MTNTCDQCLNSFSSLSNLRKHVKRFHPQQIETLGKYKHKTKNANTYAFTCQYCDRRFTYKKHLTFHLKSHNETLDGKTIKDNLSKKCPLCEYKSSFQNNLIAHFESEHDIKIIKTYTTFSGIDDFDEYLKTIETDTKSRFVKKMSTENITKFECNRSGDYLPRKNRCRALKIKGSNKINAFCPASLTLKTTENGVYQCEFLENHIGHTNDIGYLFLSKEERKNLAIKVASKIPFHVILDEVRDSLEGNNLERLHLLSKRDLNNIEKSNTNLNQEAIKYQEEDISYSAEERDKIIQDFLDITNSIKTKEQLEVLRKTVARLRPTLEALENTNKRKLTHCLNKNPHKKHVSPQRLTKKTKEKSKKNSINKPNESKNIPLSPLNNK